MHGIGLREEGGPRQVSSRAKKVRRSPREPRRRHEPHRRREPPGKGVVHGPRNPSPAILVPSPLLAQRVSGLKARTASSPLYTKKLLACVINVERSEGRPGSLAAFASRRPGSFPYRRCSSMARRPHPRRLLCVQRSGAPRSLPLVGRALRQLSGGSVPFQWMIAIAMNIVTDSRRFATPGLHRESQHRFRRRLSALIQLGAGGK